MTDMHIGTFTVTHRPFTGITPGPPPRRQEHTRNSAMRCRASPRVRKARPLIAAGLCAVAEINVDQVVDEFSGVGAVAQLAAVDANNDTVAACAYVMG